MSLDGDRVISAKERTCPAEGKKSKPVSSKAWELLWPGTIVKELISHQIACQRTADGTKRPVIKPRACTCWCTVYFWVTFVTKQKHSGVKHPYSKSWKARLKSLTSRQGQLRCKLCSSLRYISCWQSKTKGACRRLSPIKEARAR